MMERPRRPVILRGDRESAPWSRYLQTSSGSGSRLFFLSVRFRGRMLVRTRSAPRDVKF